MSLGKKKILSQGASAAPPAIDPLANFETVTYTGNGATQKITGYIRKGAAFNGSSSKIDIASTITGNNSFSVSFWLNPTANNVTPFMMGSAVSGDAFLTFVTGNTLNFGRGGDSLGSTTSNTIPNDTFTHIAVSSNAGSVTVYVNGVSNLTFSTTYDISSGGTFIGYASGYGQYFEGKIDQVRIFNKAVSASEVTTLKDETYASSTKSTTDIFSDGSGIALYELDEGANDTGGNYNGTATNVNYLGMAFSPSFVWIKSRSNGRNHRLLDSIRGATKVLSSDATVNEYNEDSLTSFDSNGFTLGTGGNQNRLSETYVAWCWYAPTSETNIAGSNGASLTSTIKKNVDAGFSIVKYTGNSSANQTVGHGLGVVPKLIIFKKINGTSDWPVYSAGLTNASYRIRLNEANAQDQTNNPFNSTAPTDSVFTVKSDAGNVNDNGQDIIAYCFADIPSYQKVGTYNGSGSSRVVEVGFTPRFLLTKSTSSGVWRIWDSTRSPSNPRNAVLRPNDSNAEGSSNVNFNATSFELAFNSPINSSNTTYIYLAIA